VPITTTLKSQNFVNFDISDNIIVILVPVVACLVHPPYIMPTISRPALMGHHTYQLVVASIEAHSVRSVQNFILFLVLFSFLLLFDLLFNDSLFLFFFSVGGLVFHNYVLVSLSSQNFIILVFSHLDLKLSSFIKRLLQISGAKLIDIQNFRECNIL
jgi:hypothetical protein